MADKPQIRFYCRTFSFDGEGIYEMFQESGEYVRTSDYRLIREAAEAENERLRQGIQSLADAKDFAEVQFLAPLILNPDVRIGSSATEVRHVLPTITKPPQ